VLRGALFLLNTWAFKARACEAHVVSVLITQLCGCEHIGRNLEREVFLFTAAEQACMCILRQFACCRAFREVRLNFNSSCI